MSARASGRRADQLREVRITRHYTRHAEGSVLIECGDTRVVCTASVEEGVPVFLKGQGRGWLTAEYGLLPRATHSRSPGARREGSLPASWSAISSPRYRWVSSAARRCSTSTTRRTQVAIPT